MKKAQTSTEYLIILAVVVVIALIVVGVMGGIPGIGRGSKEKASAAYWSTADVSIIAYSISDRGTTDNMTLKLKNNLRNTITITSITLGTFVISRSSTTLNSGGSATITNSSVGALCGAGESYSFNIRINYTDSATGAVYSFTGDGVQLEGTCAT